MSEKTVNSVLTRLIYWYKFLVARIWLISSLVLSGAICGFLISVFAKPDYVAITTFSLDEDKPAGGLAGYLGMASQLGLDFGGGGGSAFSGDNIMELIKSRAVIERALYQEEMIANKKQTLADHYLDVFELREVLEKKGLHQLNFNKPDGSRIQDSVSGGIFNSLIKNNISVAKVDKKLSIYVVKVKTSNEEFSKLFSDRLMNELSSYYVDTKTKKMNTMVNLLQNKADSIKLAYEEALYGGAVFNDMNRNIARQTVAVNNIKKQTQVQILGNYYSEVVKNLEMTKLALAKQTPLIQKIDEPKYPLEKQKIRKIVATLGGAFIAGALAVLFLVARSMIREALAE